MDDLENLCEPCPDCELVKKELLVLHEKLTAITQLMDAFEKVHNICPSTPINA